jgi:hypothetical protein
MNQPVSAYEAIELITLENHKNKALKHLTDYSQTKEMISSPININEFYSACRDYPILFAKAQEGNWISVVLLGYENQNMYLEENGSWRAKSYVPAFIRKYPFVLLQTEDKESKKQNFTLAIDKSCVIELDELSEQRAFFKEDKPTEFAQNTFGFLMDLQNGAVATAGFIKELEEWELLEEKQAQLVDSEGKTHTINGFYTVNEEKMNHLSEKKKESMCKKGAVPLITAHLISLGNMAKVIH